MKRITLLAVMLLLVVLTTGCFASRYAQSNAPTADVIEETRNFYFFGLSGAGRSILAHKICPGGVASVEMYANFFDGFWTTLTLSIWGPRTVKITCASGTTKNFYLDEKERMMVQDDAFEPFEEDAPVEDFTSSDIL